MTNDEACSEEKSQGIVRRNLGEIITVSIVVAVIAAILFGSLKEDRDYKIRMIAFANQIAEHPVVVEAIDTPDGKLMINICRGGGEQSFFIPPGHKEASGFLALKDEYRQARLGGKVLLVSFAKNQNGEQYAFETAGVDAVKPGPLGFTKVQEAWAVESNIASQFLN